MRMSHLMSAASAIALLLVLACESPADYPQPSPYPITWELKFEHGQPQRIVVQTPGAQAPKAYWYLPYTVTNETGQERTFLPDFEMLAGDGRVIRSDNKIPPAVFAAIKQREMNKLLLPSLQLAGELRLGPAEAKDGVAIWEEPLARMGQFTIFIQGASGEATTVKGPDNKDVMLRKTLQLNYNVRGSEFMPNQNEVSQESEQWIMR